MLYYGEGGPRVHITEKELECLGDRKGHDSHLAKKFFKMLMLFIARGIAVTTS